jgi:uncharacterized protein
MLVKRIRAEATVNLRSIHGFEHWERVAGYCRRIAEREDVDLRIMLLFACLHDCQRRSDGRDPEHGPRAAEYVLGLPADDMGLDAKGIERLAFACRHHTYEVPTDDLTIRACWDADRLDLGRCHIIPDPSRLFTRTAKRIARTQPTI